MSFWFFSVNWNYFTRSLPTSSGPEYNLPRPCFAGRWHDERLSIANKGRSTHLTVLVSQRRLRLRVRSDYGIGRAIGRARHVVAARRRVGVVPLIAHRRNVETFVAKTRRVESLRKMRKKNLKLIHVSYIYIFISYIGENIYGYT